MSEQIKDGGAAFPIGSGDMRDPVGMTLRDYFAAKALPAAYSDYQTSIRNGEFDAGDDWRGEIARMSYIISDAMIATRSRTRAPSPADIAACGELIEASV